MIHDNTRVLITGCGGMLGEAIHELLSGICRVRATDIDVNASWLSYLDVRDAGAIRNEMGEFRPDYIFHLAALTDLEYCENNKQETYRTIVCGTENIASVCKTSNISMVHISTAGVFDGTQDSYDDYDLPNPLNCYGKAKYEAEQIVHSYLDKYLIFRPGWMMGGGPEKDKKFVKKLVDQINSGKRELFVVTDKLGTPTYTYDFAKNMIEVINNKFYGLFNMVCKGDASRYDVAEEILKHFNLQERIRLHEVNSDFFKAAYFAKRPLSEKLVTLRLNQNGLNRMRHWKLCLKEYLSRYDWLKNGNGNG
jgi:dTDP-4-dehydrorhamnose reductase